MNSFTMSDIVALEEEYRAFLESILYNNDMDESTIRAVIKDYINNNLEVLDNEN